MDRLTRTEMAAILRDVAPKAAPVVRDGMLDVAARLESGGEIEDVRAVVGQVVGTLVGKALGRIGREPGDDDDEQPAAWWDR